MYSLFVPKVLLAYSSLLSNVVATPCEFGDVQQGETAECLAEFSNPSDTVVTLNIEPVNGRDSTDLASVNIEPRATAHVRLRADTLRDSGLVRKGFRFYNAADKKVTGIVEARGFVSAVLDTPKPEVDFGVADLNATIEPKTFALQSEDTPGVRVKSLLAVPSFVDASIADDGKSIKIQVRKDAPWGIHSELIKMELSSSTQRLAAVRIKADIQGDIVPSANPLPLGLMRVGGRNAVKLQFEDRQGHQLAIDKIDVQGISATTTTSDCHPKKRSCREVEFVLDPNQPTGYMDGVALVSFRDAKQPIRVQLWGLLVSKDTVVKDFDKEAAKSAPATDGAKSAVKPPTSILDTLKALPKQAEVPAPAGQGPLIRWQVSNEDVLYGYSVYRSDSEAGPFARINNEIIRTDTAHITNGAYAWRDTSAQPGSVYWYYVGMVRKDGSREKLTPPRRVEVKKPASP